MSVCDGKSTADCVAFFFLPLNIFSILHNFFIDLKQVFNRSRLKAYAPPPKKKKKKHRLQFSYLLGKGKRQAKLK